MVSSCFSESRAKKSASWPSRSSESSTTGAGIERPRSGKANRMAVANDCNTAKNQTKQLANLAPLVCAALQNPAQTGIRSAARPFIIVCSCRWTSSMTGRPRCCGRARPDGDRLAHLDDRVKRLELVRLIGEIFFEAVRPSQQPARQVFLGQDVVARIVRNLLRVVEGGKIVPARSRSSGVTFFAPCRAGSRSAAASRGRPRRRWCPFAASICSTRRAPLR